MSDKCLSEGGGFVFTPHLQDISLKRFRLRYSTATDCYYCHWGDAVCPPLARTEKLEKAIYEMAGVERVLDRNSGKAFISCKEDNSSKENAVISSDSAAKAVSRAALSWKLDFSGAGLAVKQIMIKARSGGDDQNENEDEDNAMIQYRVTGDSDSHTVDDLELGDFYTEIPSLHGSQTVVLTALLHSRWPSDQPEFLLDHSDEGSDCPLDIIVYLMCPNPKTWSFAGELLLGLKFNPSGAAESLRDKPQITSECGLLGGQLQVHVVEGAGFVREGSNKPFNATIRCELLPDGKSSSLTTSPRNNAYPTWAKEFIFAGIDIDDIRHGGLEVILNDHHRLLSDSIIGGLRLSVPCKVAIEKTPSPEITNTPPPESRSPSPVIFCQGPSGPRPVSCPRPLTPMFDPTGGCRSPGLPVPDSPIFRSNSLSPRPSDNAHFSWYHPPISPSSSPRSSPRLGKRNGRSPRSSPKLSKELRGKTDTLFPWMDSKGTESLHWQQVIDKQGEWVYCWHYLRSGMKPAYS